MSYVNSLWACQVILRLASLHLQAGKFTVWGRPIHHKIDFALRGISLVQDDFKKVAQELLINPKQIKKVEEEITTAAETVDNFIDLIRKLPPEVQGKIIEAVKEGIND